MGDYHAVYVEFDAAVILELGDGFAFMWITEDIFPYGLVCV